MRSLNPERGNAKQTLACRPSSRMCRRTHSTIRRKLKSPPESRTRARTVRPPLPFVSGKRIPNRATMRTHFASDFAREILRRALETAFPRFRAGTYRLIALDCRKIFLFLLRYLIRLNFLNFSTTRSAKNEFLSRPTIRPLPRASLARAI